MISIGKCKYILIATKNLFCLLIIHMFNFLSLVVEHSRLFDLLFTVYLMSICQLLLVMLLNFVIHILIFRNFQTFIWEMEEKLQVIIGDQIEKLVLASGIPPTVEEL